MICKKCKYHASECVNFNFCPKCAFPLVPFTKGLKRVNALIKNSTSRIMCLLNNDIGHKRLNFADEQLIKELLDCIELSFDSMQNA